jgi:hypothetical protein
LVCSLDDSCSLLLCRHGRQDSGAPTGDGGPAVPRI